MWDLHRQAPPMEARVARKSVLFSHRTRTKGGCTAKKARELLRRYRALTER